MYNIDKFVTYKMVILTQFLVSINTTPNRNSLFKCPR